MRRLPPQQYGHLEQPRYEGGGTAVNGARRYRIRRGDTVVEARSRPTSSGWALETQDQGFAQAVIDEIEEACRYFWERPAPEFYGCPEIEGVSDDEIDRRIQRFDEGENMREARRTMKKQFRLTELPRDRKRALVERVERIKRKYEFAWLD